MTKSRQSLYHTLFFQNPGYPHGDTLLHIVVKESKDLAEFEARIKNFNEDFIVSMSLIVNDDGFLPLDLVGYLSGYDNTEKIRERLKAYMRKGLTARVDDPVLTDPGLFLNIQLKYNLYIAEIVAKEVRARISDSATHVQMNSYDLLKQSEIEDKLSQLRSIILYQNKSPHREEVTDCYIDKYRVGNCLEYSYLALHHLEMMDASLLGEVLYNSKGDHVILVIGRNPASDLQNSSTWGDSAVVCDAWSGKVFPASEMPWMLQSFKRYYEPDGREFNVTGSYNPRYHEWINEYVCTPKSTGPTEEQMKAILIQAGKLSPQLSQEEPTRKFSF